jgi:glycosyltransferase involved in cell wall biosynthesis
MQQLTTPETGVAPRTTPAHRHADTAQRPVRVCFLIDELAPAGTESQLLALIRHLDRRRVWPYLCLLRGDKPVSQALEPDDCPILRLHVGALRHPGTLLKAGRFLRFLRRERIDVVQAYFPDSSYFGIPIAWLAGVKHRLRTRNNIGHSQTPLHRRLGCALNVFTTRTIANCAAARRALLEAEQPRPETVVVLENGVDLDRFAGIPPLTAQPPHLQPLSPLGGRGEPVLLPSPRRGEGLGVFFLPSPRGGEGLGARGPRVGIVANLRPVKGLTEFISAAARVSGRYPRAMFAVAGEGELRAELERQAVAAGLAGRFELPGCVADVPRFLAGLDVVVLCSHAEGMSNALLEYMAAGRPIVATAVGATPDLVADGVHGLLVPPRDAPRLADAIEHLLDDRELAQRLGAAARRRALEHYSREAMVRRFEEFYLALVPTPSAEIPVADMERRNEKFTEGYTWPAS